MIITIFFPSTLDLFVGFYRTRLSLRIKRPINNHPMYIHMNTVQWILNIFAWDQEGVKESKCLKQVFQQYIFSHSPPTTCTFSYTFYL